MLATLTAWQQELQRSGNSFYKQNLLIGASLFRCVLCALDCTSCLSDSLFCFQFFSFLFSVSHFLSSITWYYIEQSINH